MHSADPMLTPGATAPRVRRPTVWLLALAALLLGWRVLEPLGRDQSVFYVLGREAWHGRLPYRDLFEHKPPGILLIYAFAALLDGADGWAISVLDTVAAGLTAALLFDFVSRLRDRRAAWLAAFVYLACGRAPCFGGWWATGQPEAFQDLCVITALCCGQRHRWLWAGVAMWGALLLKFTYIGLVPVLLLWAGRSGALPLLAGLALPTALLVAIGAVCGALDPAWQAVIGFNIRHAQVDAVPWPRLPKALLRGGTRVLTGAPLAVVAGLLGLFAARQPRKWLPLGVWLAACGQLLLQRKLWLWHWNPLILPLCLAAGLYLPRALWRRPRWVLAAALLLAVPTGLGTAQEVARRLAPGNRVDVLGRYVWGGGDFSALEVAAVGLRVRALAQPDDELLVWGFEPGVYLSSGLSPGTRWLYDYPLTVGLAPTARAAAVAEVVARLPAIRWWIVFRNDANALEHLDSKTELAQIPALQQALERDYRLVAELADAAIYERAPTAAAGSSGR